ncbi:MAG: hypothetical protein IJ644_02580, partial [Oscillospiraceae bacterium]|nr:hypothetical protein [Oscillospiraceae bacterium]
AKSDPEFVKKFSTNPVKAVEDVTGIDLPDEQMNQLVSGVRTKIQNDPDFTKNLMQNPVKAVENLTGIDLPDEQINSAIKGVKDKLLGGKK